MNLLTKNFKWVIKFNSLGKYCTAPTLIYPSQDDYTPNPEYPPIDIDSESERGKKRNWSEKIKRQLTVEEKLFEINVQRRYGWKCFMVHEGVFPLNNLIFAQHMTKTHIIETENLPEFYNTTSDKSKMLTSEIKNDVMEAIEYQLDIRRHKSSEMSEPEVEEKEITGFIIFELNRILMNRLWTKEPHLKTLQIDYSPRIEASWKIDSLVETPVKKTTDYQIPEEEIPEEYLERPSDKYIQYIGHPILQLRASLPLSQLMDLSEANLLAYSVPVYKYDPHLILGYEMDRRHLNNIPGFWPGDDREFSFISYHFSNYFKKISSTFGLEDVKEALHSQALFASFGWLMPLACYQGFSSFHDVTYPMITQTVLTNNREFTFAVYQLNTTELHWQNPFENLRSNICWITPTKTLYETIEDGKLKGFNEEVLQMLVQLYLNTPKPLENVQLKPYLGDKVKHIADYEDNEKVEWLEQKFKDCCVNRVKIIKQNLYEVRDWERLYKIMFPSRPFERRRRPFELRQNPYHEKLSDAPPEYIPKCKRPDKNLPKWRQRKFRRTFFPE